MGARRVVSVAGDVRVDGLHPIELRPEIVQHGATGDEPSRGEGLSLLQERRTDALPLSAERAHHREAIGVTTPRETQEAEGALPPPRPAAHSHPHTAAAGTVCE